MMYLYSEDVRKWCKGHLLFQMKIILMVSSPFREEQEGWTEVFFG